VLHRTRHLFIRQQTAVINTIRTHLAELGLWRRSAALNQVCKATLASILRKSRPGGAPERAP
jgi:hypothetical protein